MQQSTLEYPKARRFLASRSATVTLRGGTELHTWSLGFIGFIRVAGLAEEDSWGIQGIATYCCFRLSHIHSALEPKPRGGLGEGLYIHYAYIHMYVHTYTICIGE